jgi:hypothetical protein
MHYSIAELCLPASGCAVKLHGHSCLYTPDKRMSRHFQPVSAITSEDREEYIKQ